MWIGMSSWVEAAITSATTMVISHTTMVVSQVYLTVDLVIL
jgi:hypothetical protein